MIGRLFRRLRGRPALSPATSQPPATLPTVAPSGVPRRGLLVDGHTRTWWSRGEGLATTLVETEADLPAVAQPGWVRLQGVIAGQRPESRPRANPAFSEALFVELMRAGQLRRAFAQLSPECQAAWGTPDRFASEQRGGELRNVDGVEVRDVRYLEAWRDPATATAYADVAELEVEYRLSRGGQARAVRQTVHLVPVDGHWRSVYHPPVSGG